LPSAGRVCQWLGAVQTARVWTAPRRLPLTIDEACSGLIASIFAASPSGLTPADTGLSHPYGAGSPRTGRTELHCLEVMARCLAEIKAGRWPKQGAHSHSKRPVPRGTGLVSDGLTVLRRARVGLIGHFGKLHPMYWGSVKGPPPVPL